MEQERYFILFYETPGRKGHVSMRVSAGAPMMPEYMIAEKIGARNFVTTNIVQLSKEDYESFISEPPKK